VPLVVYAILTEQNIAKLFAAAMVPGILAMLGYIGVVWLLCRSKPELAPAGERASWPQRWRALAGVWPIALVFVVVFGGIYGGWFSPTEGAAVGALATFVVALLQGELSRSGIQAAFVATAETSAMVFMIFLGADMMNATLALTAMPAALANVVSHLAVPPLVIVAAVLVFYVLLGCVMDELSMLLLTIPVLFPAVMGLDLWGLAPQDKAIWFGILVLMTVGIGMIAPPVGLNVYVVNNLARDVPMNETYKGVMPFLAWDALRVVLLLLFPALSLAAVKWMVG
jgi:C4-dicarboxylate transporter, DctM subunit